MIWHLTISTFVGISPGAKHFQGNLQSGIYGEDRRTIHLERTMTAKEVRDENKRAQSEFGFSPFKRGEKTKGFCSEEEVIAAARAKFATFATPGDVLLNGGPMYLDPVEPLAGPEDFMREAQELYVAYEANDGWSGNQAVAKRLCDRWEKLRERYAGR